MPRDGSNADVVWYDIDPCYVYHPLNAYEDGEDIVIEVCRLPHTMKSGASEEGAVLHRWTVHSNTGRVTETQLDDRFVEFPRVPDALVGLKHRYGYMAEFDSSLPQAIAVRKYDLHTGTSVAHELAQGCLGGEPVFVPAASNVSGTSDEDSGYLMTFVYDQVNDQSELLVIDAASMDAEPVARVHIPVRIPAGFHGSWVAD